MFTNLFRNYIFLPHYYELFYKKTTNFNTKSGQPI